MLRGKCRAVAGCLHVGTRAQADKIPSGFTCVQAFNRQQHAGSPAKEGKQKGGVGGGARSISKPCSFATSSLQSLQKIVAMFIRAVQCPGFTLLEAAENWVSYRSPSPGHLLQPLPCTWGTPSSRPSLLIFSKLKYGLSCVNPDQCPCVTLGGAEHPYHLASVCL